MASGFPGIHEQPPWIQVFQEFMNNPMASGFPGLQQQPNAWLKLFQKFTNNPMAGFSFSRNSRTTQWLAPAFPEIHKQPNGLLQLFQEFTNNPMTLQIDTAIWPTGFGTHAQHVKGENDRLSLLKHINLMLCAISQNSKGPEICKL
jgi:hypothetical protein